MIRQGDDLFLMHEFTAHKKSCYTDLLITTNYKREKCDILVRYQYIQNKWFFFPLKNFCFNYMCICIGVYVHVSAGAHRVQKRASDSLALGCVYYYDFRELTFGPL